MEAALRAQRLLGQLAVVVLSMMCLLMAPSAFADGGAGGTGNGNAGGSGGTGYSGSSGGSGASFFGGGGGGAAGGGAGGSGLVAGGSGGTANSHNGQTGTSVIGVTSGIITIGSAGGGGGGWNGNDTGTAGSGQVTISNSGTLTGGKGGDGGGVFNLFSLATFGSGGGGGGGGYGAIVTGSASASSNSGTITGGNGGLGGTASGPGTQGGSGGDGGIGVLFTGSSVVFTNTGSITGGNGGAEGVGGPSFGVGGVGGAGIVGSSLTIINSGSIAGGTSGFFPGVSTPVQADAITFTGGANSLTLVGSGWSLTGNIAINGGGSLTFNQSTAQTLTNAITGDGSVIQNGLGTLTLTGANTYSGGTTVTAGLINFAAGNNLGTGAITLNGGGLQWATGNTLDISSRLTALGAGGGTVDTNGNNVTFASALTGIGSLTKAGIGTLTLNAANSYSGGTVIAGGTIKVGNDSALGTGTVNMTASGTTLNLNGHTVGTAGLSGVAGSTVQFGTGSALGLNVAGGTSQSFAGNLVDNGSAFNFVLKSGAGTQSLSGNNTLGGVFAVQQGTLSLDSTTAMTSAAFLEVSSGAQVTVNGVGVTIGELVTTGSGDGTVTIAGGSLTVAQAGAVNAFAGRLTGSGAFIVNGSGGLVQTLSGTSDYSGATTVVQGTLRAGANNSFSANSAHTISSGATLDLNGFNETIGSLAGAGAVTLRSGTLTAGGDGSSTTFSGVISGSGGLIMTGGGSLTLGGPNTYLGGTTIAGGTLQLSGAGTLGDATGSTTVGAAGTLDLGGTTQTQAAVTLAGGILRNGALNTVIASTGGTIDGIGGNSSLTTTSGTTVLSGTNTIGLTTVTGGRVAVNGILTGNVGVDVAGTLGGSGTINGIVVNVGTISPGNSIGTLSISGAYLQAGGSTYQVEVNGAGQSDRINVTGAPGFALLLGGTVQVTAAPGTYAHTTTYTILSATGGVAGTFDGVTSNFAFLKPSLSYDADDVFLVLTRSGFSGGALTPNQHAVGTALDRGDPGATGDFETVLNVLSGLDATQGPGALDAISGQPYANFGTVNTAMGYAFANAIGNQLSGWGGATHVALAEACDVACDATAPSRWGAWLSGVGGLGSVPGQSGNSGTFTYNFGGTAVGLDYRLDPRVLVGASLGFTTGTQWVNGFNGRGSVDAFSGSLYGSFTEDALYVNAVAGYSHASNRLTRVITIPGLLQRTAYGKTTADQFVGQVEAGYHFALGPGSVTPFARLQGSTTNQAGFSEWGADSLDLSVASQTTNSLRSTLGAELQNQFGPVDLHLRLGWLHEYADTVRPMTASFAGAPGMAFTVFGASPQRDSAAIGFSGRTKVGEATELYARYDGEVGGGSDNHAFMAGLRMVW
ncbi:MAG TPA: autotransporter domain-containing protein [Reyranella sp.]|nr:autotransporter domain-containing protein [Reyranella sp.]